jgi:hypothetical protein
VWGFLFGLIDPVTRIIGKLADAKVDLAKAQTDQERIHAEERVKGLEARRDVLIAEAGSRINAMIRAGFALPFVIYNAKLVLWDKVLADITAQPIRCRPNCSRSNWPALGSTSFMKSARGSSDDL